MSKETFARNLSKFMVAFDVSEKEFMDEMGVSYDRLRSWKVSIAYPKLEMMVKVCDFFGFKDIYRLVNEEIDINEIKHHAKAVRATEEAAA